jgi:hypothetical protein
MSRSSLRRSAHSLVTHGARSGVSLSIGALEVIAQYGEILSHMRKGSVGTDKADNDFAIFIANAIETALLKALV